MTDEEGHFCIDAELGELSLEVSGPDEDWVKETFDEEWAERIGEAENMAKALREAHRGEFQ